MTEDRLPEPIRIQNIPIHPLSVEELAKVVSDWALEGSRRRIYHVNAHALNLAAEIEAFSAALRRADLVYCDGAGVQIAARILRQRIQHRLAVMDWIDVVLDRLAGTGSSVFLLGDEEEVVQEARLHIQERHPSLLISGHHHGFFRIDGKDNEHVLARLREESPRVVFIGMGMPRQELWIESNLTDLPECVLIPVGAAFTWYSGRRKRPPRWVRDHSLEWLGRLTKEPGRLWRRYLIGNPQLLVRAFLTRWRQS